MRVTVERHAIGTRHARQAVVGGLLVNAWWWSLPEGLAGRLCGRGHAPDGPGRPDALTGLSGQRRIN